MVPCIKRRSNQKSSACARCHSLKKQCVPTPGLSALNEQVDVLSQLRRGYTAECAESALASIARALPHIAGTELETEMLELQKEWRAHLAENEKA